MPKNKIVGSMEELANVCQSRRLTGERIVLTTGCYDLLHGGHLEYICDAGSRGWLVVGVNSDSFVKRIKGNNRPIRSQDDRALVIAGFYPVRLVVIFDCDYELLKAVRPDIYVASTTYRVRVWDDKKRMEILRAIGTEIVELDAVKIDSTTAIIDRIRCQF